MAQMDLKTVQLFVATFNQHFPADPNPDSGNCTTHARALAEALVNYQSTIETSEHSKPDEFIIEYIANPQNFFRMFFGARHESAQVHRQNTQIF